MRIRPRSGGSFCDLAVIDEFDEMKNILMEEVRREFRPEFLNRLDDIVFFRSLTRVDLNAIIDCELADMKSRLVNKGIELRLTEAAREFLIEEGFSPEYGARPLRRAISKFIEDPMAEFLLGSVMNVTAEIEIERDGNELKFRAIEKKTEEKVEEPVVKAKKGSSKGNKN